MFGFPYNPSTICFYGYFISIRYEWRNNLVILYQLLNLRHFTLIFIGAFDE